MLILNQDLLNWIDCQKERNVEMWNAQIFKFEDFLYEKLDWNIDFVTSSDILNFFLETHFSELIDSEDFNLHECDSDIITCFISNYFNIIAFYKMNSNDSFIILTLKNNNGLLYQLLWDVLFSTCSCLKNPNTVTILTSSQRPTKMSSKNLFLPVLTKQK